MENMRVIISGVGGRMGTEVAKMALAGMRGAVPVAGYDVQPASGYSFPCYTKWDDVKEEADVIIDFSFHTGTPDLLKFALDRKLPVVLCTTGQTEEELTQIEEASKSIAIFRSANMSVGVALLVELAKKTAETFPDADIEIIETHHNRKMDAPSGTALMLANAIREVRTKAQFVFGRHGQGKRQPDDIGIHAVRMGNVVGEHEVIVGTDTQTITLKHQAHSRALFAEGAFAAAEYLVGQKPGIYDMQSMLAKK